jgi:hypothetical protein
MARRVQFTDEAADGERFSLNKRIPTPRAARRRDSTSSSTSEESAPVVRKNRSRRSKKGSRSSNSNSSRRRGILSRRKQREDGRASAKERKRKSQLARILPRRPNGKFAPISGSITPQNRSSRPPFQQRSYPEESEESDSNSESDSGDASFLNTTAPKLPAGKYIQQFVKTPEGQKMLRKQLMKTLTEMGGSLLNFDSDDDEQDRNKNPTPPRQRRSSSRSRM